jgi:hypothetical protein
MKASLGKYDWALFDQNGFVYVLKTWHPVENKRKVYLERSFYLNGYWRDLPTERLGVVKPFVKHFMGCQFCSGINVADLTACQDDFEATWQYADAQSVV